MRLSRCWTLTVEMHVDAGELQLLDVLVALGAGHARRVRVRELVHQGDLGRARDHGVDVHLAQRHAAVLELERRDDLEALGHGGGVGPAVRLEPADDDVAPLARAAPAPPRASCRSCRPRRPCRRRPSAVPRPARSATPLSLRIRSARVTLPARRAPRARRRGVAHDAAARGAQHPRRPAAVPAEARSRSASIPGPPRRSRRPRRRRAISSAVDADAARYRSASSSSRAWRARSCAWGPIRELTPAPA